MRARGAAEKRAAVEAAQDAKAKGVHWDSATRAGDASVGKVEAEGVRDHVDEFLRMNPELKGVHSGASVRVLLSRDGNV